MRRLDQNKPEHLARPREHWPNPWSLKTVFPRNNFVRSQPRRTPTKQSTSKPNYSAHDPIIIAADREGDEYEKIIILEALGYFQHSIAGRTCDRLATFSLQGRARGGT